METTTMWGGYVNRRYLGMLGHYEDCRRFHATREATRATGEFLPRLNAEIRLQAARERLLEEMTAQGISPQKIAVFIGQFDFKDSRRRKPTAAAKTRYSCPACEANAWGKPGLNILCGDCDEPMCAEA